MLKAVLIAGAALALLAAGSPKPAEAGLPTGKALASLVGRAFPDHDTNGDGKLSRAEFAAWMVALKSQSDPNARTASAKTRKWVAGAFALADKDGNAGVTKAELTTLLQGASKG